MSEAENHVEPIRESPIEVNEDGEMELARELTDEERKNIEALKGLFSSNNEEEKNEP